MFSLSQWKARRAWDQIKFEIDLRQETLFHVTEQLKNKLVSSDGTSTESTPKRLLSLAATDVFVEKAQRTLATRAWLLIAFGVIGSASALCLLLGAAYLIFEKSLSAMLDPIEIGKLNGLVLTLVIVKSTAAGALLIASATFLMHLGKALFHEATILLNRRHALRFGRLFIYLKDGAISLKDLEAAFKWNDEFSTAFKDIGIDPVAPKSAVQALAEAIVKADPAPVSRTPG
jgi:hypothetical protein